MNNTTEDILTLAKKFISFASTEEHPQELSDIIAFAKNQLSDYPAQEFLSNAKPSILIHNAKSGTKHFKIILNAHLDVVPGRKEQYTPEEKDGKLFGRGAYDMKAAAAVMLLLFGELAKKVTYPLALQLVTDEEISGYNGTKYQIDKGITADFVIAGENTGGEIRNKAKSPLWLKIKTLGKTSHAAYPWLGENAVLKMYSILGKIEKMYPTPKAPSWTTTVNVSKIETKNSTYNRVPEDCAAWLDIRVIPEDHDVMENIKKILPENTEIEVDVQAKPAYTDPDNTYIKQLQQAIKKMTGTTEKISGANGASDVRFFNEKNIPGVEFGPKGAGAHSDEEWVDIKSLENYYHILKEFLLTSK